MFLSKIVPLILIIFGIIKMLYKELNQLYIPGILILIAMVIGLILIEKIKKDNKNDSKKVYINYLINFTRILMLNIPNMSLIFLSKIFLLILIIFEIIKMSYKELNQFYILCILILIAMVIGLILIEKIKKDNKNDSKKVYINYLITFTRPLMLTLPLMSLAFLFLMTI